MVINGAHSATVVSSLEGMALGGKLVIACCNATVNLLPHTTGLCPYIHFTNSISGHVSLK